MNSDVSLDKRDAIQPQRRAGDRELECIGPAGAGIRKITKRRPLQRQPTELGLLDDRDIVDQNRGPAQTLNAFGAGIDFH